jgi:hypothetical protein
MLLATDAMIPLLNQSQILGVTNRKMLTLYDGTMPTKEELETGLYSTVSGTGIASTTRGLYRQDLIHNLALAKGGILRGYVNYPTNFALQMMGPNKLRFPLSERPEELIKSAIGNVTYFILSVVASTVVAPTTNGAVHWVGVGTVGAAGSGADMILFGGAIDNSRAVKMNDQIFTFDGV